MRYTVNVIAALIAGTLLVSMGAGDALAQYRENPILQRPSVTTPIPRQAPPPPPGWSPAPPLPPAIRQSIPWPSCLKEPCNGPPLITRP
ncbi:hypothetical protein [Ancylobacter amanitiformis]|uniref:Uncharacterized protein n=1 Tax=Ancylobacter amanitiformis TaxID=217069 RepID=A0ABU0LRU7_9HYPH|nr:hypothetical protein [Ancylobacter amanitiformis]MDQ0511431.1 hypothetical protein [Ancylobacter amanitiformis]